MCQHQIAVERRPDPDNCETWTELDCVTLGDGRRLSAEELEGGWARAQHLCEVIALADWEIADELHVVRSSCQGYEEQRLAFPDGYAKHRREQAEQSVIYRLLEAARASLREAGDETHEDMVMDAMDFVWREFCHPAQAAGLAAENRRLRAALRFYADDGNWRMRPREGGGLDLPLLADAGTRARHALDEGPERS